MLLVDVEILSDVVSVGNRRQTSTCDPVSPQTGHLDTLNIQALLFVFIKHLIKADCLHQKPLWRWSICSTQTSSSRIWDKFNKHVQYRNLSKHV